MTSRQRFTPPSTGSHGPSPAGQEWTAAAMPLPRRRCAWARRPALSAGLAACLLAAGCAAGSTAAAGSPAAGTGTRVSSPAHAPDRRAAGVRKILVIMEENHDPGEVFPAGMPYLWSLARRYGRATAWHDVTNPSLPNYLAIFGGSAFGDPQDCDPGTGCTFQGASVFGQAAARGLPARSYEESMPRPCDRSSSGNYDVNHNPWAYFPAETAACQSGDVPAGTPRAGALASDVRSGRLPAVGLLTPNLLHDAHNGTLAQADAWLRGWIPVLQAGPDWRAGRLAIVVVFDEGDVTGRVPFVLIAPGVSGVVMHERADQYALTRLIGQVIGAPPLRHAATAVDVAPLLRLHVR